MSNQPLVSVCINAYNAEHTIRRTVESVLSQTYQTLQVIVVDDCSTDDTVAVLRSFDDPRLEIVPLTVNDHISNANNEALARVRGEYVAHLDADDVWYPDKIKKQLTFLQTHPDYAACFSLAQMVDENDNCVEDHRFRAENGTRTDILYRMLTNGNYLCHSSMFAKKELMDRVGEHDLSLLYFHDYDYWLRMLMHGAIYILPEELLDYRISTGSNSFISEEKQQAHVNEMARVLYNTIVNCEDTLFCETFASRMRKPSLEPTPARIALEKAFVLLELFIYLPHNRALGLRYLAELMANKHYVDVARTDFDFTVHDYYALCATTVYHNAVERDAHLAEITHLRNLYVQTHTAWHDTQTHAANLQEALNAQTARCAQLDERLAQAQNTTAVLTAELHKALAAHENAAAQLHAVTSSKAWRLTAPIRKLHQLAKTVRTWHTPRTKDGKRAACTIAMYGYFAHNLGDDLFFDTLLTRYPDAVFVAYDANNYAAFFNRYPNAYVYERSHPQAQRMDAWGAKRGQQDAFEHFLLRYCDAVVHIGGSIYQQIGSWEEDLRLREKRISKKRPFFSLSSNFGPYHSDGYRQHWHERFAKSRDICFRDTYSQQLFGELDTVRYAPDLLFSLPLPEVATVAGRLFLSVVNLAACDTDAADRAEEYTEKMADIATQWLLDGGTVCLSSFCAFQNDIPVIDAIIARIPETVRHGVTTAHYTDGNFKEVLTAVCQSEYVLATRFHAMLFGLTAAKPTLPICYNDKMVHVLDDIGFTGTRLTPSSLCDTATADIVNTLRTQPLFDVSEQRKSATEQFMQLDAFIRRHGGTVNE